MANRLGLFVIVVLVALGLVSLANAVLITTQAAQVTLSVGTPTIGTCGTSPSVVAGSTDAYGQITTGSGVVTACTWNFSHTLSRTPVCIVSTSSTAVTADINTVSSSALTVGLSATLTSGQIYYHCLGAS